MKNADKTAYPQVESCEEGRDGRYFFHSTEGLTKRERFAMAAMQGLCNRDANGSVLYVDIAFEAVKFTDALLKELEKTQ